MYVATGKRGTQDCGPEPRTTGNRDTRGSTAGSVAIGSSATEYDLVRWGESLAAIARTGLGFTESLFERERYEEVLRVAADIRVAADMLRSEGTGAGCAANVPEGERRGNCEVDGTAGEYDPEALVAEWMRSVGKGVPGYVTPKVAVGAVVGNDEGQILLVRRADSGIWLYPTGWADIGYSASEVAVKEVAEETGIEVEPVRLIAVLDGFRLGITRIPLYSLVFQCRALGGHLRPHPLECLEVGWFSEDALPSPLAGAERWRSHAFKAIRGEPLDVLYDVARNPVWRGDPALGVQGAV